jgi:hypothetical protein
MIVKPVIRLTKPGMVFLQKIKFSPSKTLVQKCLTMPKSPLPIIFLFSFVLNALGQSDSEETKINARNSVFIEILGSAGYLYNITYDRVVFSREQNHISTGLGIQYLPSDLSRDHISSISPQINYFHGTTHHFETGLAVAYDFYSGDLAIPIRIGYRFQKSDGGLFYKIGLTPLLTKSYPILGEGFSMVPWGDLQLVGLIDEKLKFIGDIRL